MGEFLLKSSRGNNTPNQQEMKSFGIVALALLFTVTGSNAFDTDGSGGLSREEIVSALEMAFNTTINPEEVDSAVVDMFNKMFQFMESEFNMDFEDFSEDVQETLEEMFDNMDSNNDEALSMEEIGDAIKWIIGGMMEMLNGEIST